MSWVRIDDKFHAHRKVTDLPLDAVGLWTLALSWTHDNAAVASESGFVSAGVARRFAGTKAKRLARVLVDAGLWRETEGGWVFHDWADYLEPQRLGRRANVVHDLARRDGPLCRGCRVTPANVLDLEIDHVMPRALGGNDCMSNLQLLCGPCNRRKAAKHPDAWRALIDGDAR
jgi:hypothetical protein